MIEGPNYTLNRSDSQFAITMAIARFNTGGGISREDSLRLVLSMMDRAVSDEEFQILLAQLISQTSDPALETMEDHSELRGRENDDSWFDLIEEWPHLNSLRVYRDTNTSLSENAKNNLELTSERILRSSYDPNTDGFLWRGMVVGNVQSGKTAAFSTLIARAFDVGYRLVIVPSGRLDSLRDQTSSRLHTELVESLPEDIRVSHITRQNDTIFRHTEGPIFTDFILPNMLTNRNLLVTKKDANVLRNLNTLLHTISRENEEFRNLPVLVIDDECDEAGIDISSEPDENTRINFELKRLISNPNNGQILRRFTRPNQQQEIEVQFCPGFRRVMFLGFTATPFATLFQRKNDDANLTETEGEDLFPHDYLLVLDDSPLYCGGEVFLGRNEINSDPGYGPERILRLPAADTGLDTVCNIPANDACADCRNQSIQLANGQTITTHIGQGRRRHFWRVINNANPNASTENPILASTMCDCECHTTDEKHLLVTPFRDARHNWEPQLTDSLSRAIDDYILSGAAILERQRGHDEVPVSMMLLISVYTAQHLRIRDLIRDRVETIINQWPAEGAVDRFNHESRLRLRWNDGFIPSISQVNDGFVFVGGGSDSENQNRVFQSRAVPHSTEFDELRNHIPDFLQQIEYVILNSDNSGQSSQVGFDNNGDTVIDGVPRPNLKGVWIGGYNLGRGLTLKNLVTTFMLRSPGDSAIATQIQRWCGYRIFPVEDILDLMKLYIPEQEAHHYRSMLTVERINRSRLSLYAELGHTPTDVFHLLEESEDYALVSAAKRGEMIRLSNPLQGEERTETTFFLHDSEESNSQNWIAFENLLSRCLEDSGVTNRYRNSGPRGWIFENIPAALILELISDWNAAPHRDGGFNLDMIERHINQSLVVNELESWSVLFPVRTGEVAPETLGFILDPEDGGFGAVDIPETRAPVSDIGGLGFANLNAWTRGLSATRTLSDGRRTYRFGTVSDPSWRTADLEGAQAVYPRPNGTPPLLVVAPIMNPFNLRDPCATSFPREIPNSERFNPSGQWNTLPSLSFIFPVSNTQILHRTVGHGQYQ